MEKSASVQKKRHSHGPLNSPDTLVRTPQARLWLKGSLRQRRIHHGAPEGRGRRTWQRPCGTSLQLTHEISSLIGPSPTYFATQHCQTRSAAPWAGQLRVSVFLLVSCLLQSCSVVVSTLATCTPIPSVRRHQTRVASTASCAMEQRKSVCHNLNLPVIDPPWRKEIEISHADVD